MLTAFDDHVIFKQNNGKSIIRRLCPKTKIRLFNLSYDSHCFINLPFGSRLKCVRSTVEIAPYSAIDTYTRDSQYNKQLNPINLGSIYGDQKKAERAQARSEKFVHIVKPTAASLADALTPKAIQYLRKETLGDILLKSNLSSGSSCIVLDRTNGLLTGAVAERARGRIVCVLDAKTAAVALADAQLMAFLRERRAFQRGRQLLAAKAKTNGEKAKRAREGEEGFQTEGEAKKVFGAEEKTVRSVEAADEPMAEAAAERNREAVEKLKAMKTAKDKRHKNNNFLVLNQNERGDGSGVFFVRHSTIENVVELEGDLFDSLILTIDPYHDDIEEAINTFWRFLRPNGHFVLYCHCIEPLSQCAAKMGTGLLATNLQLESLITFGINVKEGRTRPSNKAEGLGGFVLSGIKIAA